MQLREGSIRTLPNNMSAEIVEQENGRVASGRRLRAIATSLLVVMGLVFLGSTWAMENIHHDFVWLKAFAEAALVGGLADWFAVTALFRRPMGLPIPHTAIIPRSKDRIGDTLARFLRENFLTPDIISAKLEQLDTARLLADFLSRPMAGGRVRQGAMRLLGQLLDTPAANEIGEKLKSGAIRQLESTNIAPLAGRMIDAMVAERRHVPLVDSIIQWTIAVLDSQEGLIHDMVTERTSWILKLVKVDDKIAGALVNGLQGLLHDIAADPDHPVRERAGHALQKLAYGLKHVPATQEKMEALKLQLIHNPALTDWLDGMWQEARGQIGTFLESETAGEISAAIAKALREDEGLAEAVNQISRRAILGVVQDHGDMIVGLVSETVRGWDAATITEKLENAVLRDLQYIRFNGTMIGGLIGLGLHGVLVLTGHA